MGGQSPVAELGRTVQQKQAGGGAANQGMRLSDIEPAQLAVRLAQRPALEGREELLAALDVRLADRDQAGPGIVALVGLGGVGKTSVAVEYAHRQAGGCAVVWQLLAEDPAGLAAGFGELAARLGGRDRLGPGDPVAVVHAALARRDDWLLVFDNVPSPAAVEGLLPPAGRGRVVITSQFGSWPGRQVLEVPVLDRDIAAGFLLERTGATALRKRRRRPSWPESWADAAGAGAGRRLYAGLGPDHRGVSGAVPGAAGGTAGPGGIRPGMTAGRHHLGSSACGARRFRPSGGIAAAGGMLRGRGHPLGLLLRPGLAAKDFAAGVGPVQVPLLEDELARDEAVAGLRRFSLISAPQGGLVSVHRLVQAITLDQLSPQEADAWRQAAAAVIEAAMPSDPKDPGSWPVFAALLRMPRPRWTRPATACISWPGTSQERRATPRRWPYSADPARNGGNPGRRAP